MKDPLQGSQDRSPPASIWLTVSLADVAVLVVAAPHSGWGKLQFLNLTGCGFFPLSVAFAVCVCCFSVCVVTPRQAGQIACLLFSMADLI